MSICKSGLDCKLEHRITLSIKVETNHPLIKLANSLEWLRLFALVLPDLKNSTTKLKWWLGRKLKLRTHLGVYLLQQLLNETDRGIEQAIRYNAAYQVFCGKTIVTKWSCPDHTKIEAFRSRLSPKTHCLLANEIAAIAVKFGFAKPHHVDIDSTVQEPEMQYPATSNLLVKTAVIARRIQKWCAHYLPEQGRKVQDIDIKKVKGIAREHYFAKRKKSIEQKASREAALKKLWQQVSQITLPVVQQAKQLTESFLLTALTQQQRHCIEHFIRKAPLLLSGLFERCFESLPRKIKLYSYFRDAVHCFNKLKHHKACEFGRQFQMGRLQGNYLFSIPNDSIQMPDAASLKSMILRHIETFQTPIESLGTDKGYYSKENEQLALDFGISHVAIQRPCRKLDKPPDNPISEEQLALLTRRRSGIEPLIGHLKRYWQMGRSRMKHDLSTESSGYCAILGFNLRQLVRHLSDEATALSS